jgi:hypothetical protein
MKKLFLITSILLSSTIILVAQEKTNDLETKSFIINTDNRYHEYPDSVRIEFPNQQSLVVFRMKELEGKDSVISKFPNRLKTLLKELEASIVDTDKLHLVNVQYRANGNHTISIKEQEEKTTEIISQNSEIIQLLPPGWDIYIKTENESIYVYSPSFEKLTALILENFELTAKGITTEIEQKPLHRKGLIAKTITKNNQLEYTNFKRRGVGDLLVLYADFGFGYLYNQLYPEVNATLSVVFKDRTNVIKQQVNLSLETMYLSNKTEAGILNSKLLSFLSLSTDWAQGKNNKYQSSFGVGFGLSLQENSLFFTDRAYKLFFNKTIGNFTLSPQFYRSIKDKNNSIAGFSFKYRF